MSGSGGNNAGVYNLEAVKVSNGVKPAIAKVYSFPFILTGGNQSLDLTPLANLHRIANVQGIAVSNQPNATALTITTNAGQSLTIPGTYQCLMPVFLAQDNVVTFNGSGTIQVTLLNFPTAAAVWPTSSSETVTISGTAAVNDATGNGLLAQIAPGVSPASRSITGDTASQALAAANPAREYILIQSGYLSGTFYDVWVNFIGGTASVGGVDCVRIPAGSFYESGAKVPLGEINVICATNGVAINAIEG
jgi:hypothetical protein